MTSKRTSTAISDDVQEDMDALEVELKSSLRKTIPSKRNRPSDFNVSYDARSGKRVTTGRKKSCKPKRLPKANRKY